MLNSNLDKQAKKNLTPSFVRVEDKDDECANTPFTTKYSKVTKPPNQNLRYGYFCTSKEVAKVSPLKNSYTVKGSKSNTNISRNTSLKSSL